VFISCSAAGVIIMLLVSLNFRFIFYFCTNVDFIDLSYHLYFTRLLCNMFIGQMRKSLLQSIMILVVTRCVEENRWEVITKTYLRHSCFVSLYLWCLRPSTLSINGSDLESRLIFSTLHQCRTMNPCIGNSTKNWWRPLQIWNKLNPRSCNQESLERVFHWESFRTLLLQHGNLCSLYL